MKLRNSLFAVVFSVLVIVGYASAESIYLPIIAKGETVPPVQAEQARMQRYTIYYFLYVVTNGEPELTDSFTPEQQALVTQISEAMSGYVFSTQMNVVRYFTHVYRTDNPDNKSLSPLPNKIEPLCRELALLLGADGLEPIIPDPVEPAQAEEQEQ